MDIAITLTALVAVLATIAAHRAQALTAGIALILLLVWTALYATVSAPINRRFTAAADADDDLPNARALQAKWDRIIDTRAALQGLAVLALCVGLVL